MSLRELYGSAPAPPWQWQCGECAAWVDGGWSVHVHTKIKEPSLEQMIHARRMDDMLPGSANALEVEVEKTTYWRTGKEPTREKPL